MLVALCLAVSAALVACPWIVHRAIALFGSGELPLPRASAPVVVGTNFQAAIADLAIVRRRLIETKQLDDKSRAAIDTLTLALVAGSDQ
jgi:hypothetical protein